MYMISIIYNNNKKWKDPPFLNKIENTITKEAIILIEWNQHNDQEIPKNFLKRLTSYNKISTCIIIQQLQALHICLWTSHILEKFATNQTCEYIYEVSNKWKWYWWHISLLSSTRVSRVEFSKHVGGDTLQHFLGEDTQQLPSNIQRFKHCAVLIITLWNEVLLKLS